MHPIGSNNPTAILFIPKLWMRLRFIDICWISDAVKTGMSCHTEKCEKHIYNFKKEYIHIAEGLCRIRKTDTNLVSCSDKN